MIDGLLSLFVECLSNLIIQSQQHYLVIGYLLCRLTHIDRKDIF